MKFVVYFVPETVEADDATHALEIATTLRPSVDEVQKVRVPWSDPSSDPVGDMESWGL